MPSPVRKLPTLDVRIVNTELPEILNKTNDISVILSKTLTEMINLRKKSIFTSPTISAISSTVTSSKDLISSKSVSYKDSNDGLNFSKDFTEHFIGKFKNSFSDFTTFFGFDFGKYLIDGVKKMFTGRGILGGALALPFKMMMNLGKKGLGSIKNFGQNLFLSKEGKIFKESEKTKTSLDEKKRELSQNEIEQQEATGKQKFKLLLRQNELEQEINDLTEKTRNLKIKQLKLEFDKFQEMEDKFKKSGDSIKESISRKEKHKVALESADLSMKDVSDVDSSETSIIKPKDMYLFNSGTKGVLGELFGNFGGGTLVMLHGKEAVVPLNSIEGKLLQQFSTGDLDNFSSGGEGVKHFEKSDIEIISPQNQKNDSSVLDVFSILEKIFETLKKGFQDLSTPLDNIEKSFKEDSDRNEQLLESDKSRQNLLSMTTKSDDETDSNNKSNNKSSNENKKSLWETIKNFIPSLMSIGKLLTIFGASLLAAITISKIFWPNLLEEFKSLMSELMSKIRDAFSPLVVIFKRKIVKLFGDLKIKILEKFSNLKIKILESDFFKKIVNSDFFKKISVKWDEFKKVLKEFFEKMASKLRNIKSSSGFEKFKSVMIRIWNLIKSAGKILWSVVKLIPGVGMTVNMGKGLLKIFKFLKFIGKIFKKLFFPLTIILSVWDTIQGAIKGYEKGGIVGGIKGALIGLFDSLVGGLADLVKDGVSWILKQLGFEELSKKLDSFSFKDMFAKLVEQYFFIFGEIFSPPEGGWDFTSIIAKLFDVLTLPIMMGINNLLETFGMKDANSAPLMLSDVFSKIWFHIKESFNSLIDLFARMPAFIDMKLKTMLSWFFKKEEIDAAQKAYEDKVREQEAAAQQRQEEYENQQIERDRKYQEHMRENLQKKDDVNKLEEENAKKEEENAKKEEKNSEKKKSILETSMDSITESFDQFSELMGMNEQTKKEFMEGLGIAGQGMSNVMRTGAKGVFGTFLKGNFDPLLESTGEIGDMGSKFIETGTVKGFTPTPEQLQQKLPPISTKIHGLPQKEIDHLRSALPNQNFTQQTNVSSPSNKTVNIVNTSSSERDRLKSFARVYSEH